MLHTFVRALRRDISCKATLNLSQSVRRAHLWGTSAHTSDHTVRTPDCIHLKGLTFHGYHGVLPEVLSQACYATKLNYGQSRANTNAGKPVGTKVCC